MRCSSGSPGRASASRGSRAATRWCSAAPARKSRRCARPASPTTSCPASRAALAAAADTATPVTLRKVSPGFVFATAHGASDEELKHWASLAASGLTLALYMGKSIAASTAIRCIRRRRARRDAGRHRRQRRPHATAQFHRGTLGELADGGGELRATARRSSSSARPSPTATGRTPPRSPYAKLQGRLMEILTGNELDLAARRSISTATATGSRTCSRRALFAKEEAADARCRDRRDQGDRPDQQPRDRNRDGDRRRRPSRPHPRAHPRRRARPPRASTASIWARTAMYRYDEFDAAFVTRAHRAVLRPGAPPPQRRDERGPVPAAAADERALPAAPRLHAAHRGALRHAVVEAAAHARPHRAHLRPQLRPLHDAPEHPVQLAQAQATSRRSSRTSRRSRCTRSRPRATASATSRPTSSPAPRPTRSSIRGRSRKSSASGRASIRNSRYLPRKFKIAMTGAPSDRAAIKFHDIGLQADDQCRGRDRLGGLGRRRPRPHADDRQADQRLRAARAPARLSREHPARLQPLRPARQQVQGADQDPRPRDRHRDDPRGGRGRVRRRSRAAC